MTKEEAIELIKHIGIAFVPTDQYGDYDDPEPYEEAIDMAIEALSAEAEQTIRHIENNTKESDLVYRPSAKAVPIHEDGTLEVKVPNAQKVGRVLVMDTDSHIGGGLFYPESAEAVQGWIPCSERLPSEDGCYLVCMNFKYGNIEVLKWVDGWNCYRGPNGEICRGSEIDRADIIAWMPLPEPYKGGNTDD